VISVSDSELHVLYEDNHCLVLAKPAGLLMAGDATGDDTLLDCGKRYIREKYSKPGNVYLGVVHRLDRPVSGVALFARTSKAAARISAQFREGQVQKVYHAWVDGRPPTESEVLVDYLVKDADRNVSRTAASDESGAREAQLEYRVLRTESHRSLLEIRPQTGRPHQIRVQLASRGWPILGDVKYGGPQCSNRRAIALHAQSLTLKHPTLSEEISVSLDLPAIWSKWFGVSR
jgi:23S rRNA pseudouridine1911/1915/1917 synthase